MLSKLISTEQRRGANLSEQRIQDLLETAIQNLNGIADTGSVIGNPIQTPDGTVVIPISRTSLGFVTGGTEFPNSVSPVLPFGGGVAGSVSLTPIAFLIIGTSGVQTVTLEPPQDIYSRILDLSPELLDKLKNLLNR